MNLAWATGLFEGEGCIYRDPRSCSFRLTINSTDEDVLRRFHKIVGVGKIIEGKHVERNKHHKPFWIWATHRRNEVYALLELMLPYLGERRGFAALNALDVYDRVC